MDQPEPSARRAWRWVPSLYFAQGIPNVAVATLAVAMYVNLGISNAEIALQFVLGTGMALIAFTLPTDYFFQATLAVFWLIAFSSATHDIAADGFYLLALKKSDQAAFVGVRSTFFRISMIAGQGGLLLLAERWAGDDENFVLAWSMVFGLLATVFLLVACYHVWALPRVANDQPGSLNESPWPSWWTSFRAFFQKRDIVTILGFLLLFRIAEAQLLKLFIPFMLDEREAGGLALNNEQIGVLYGTFGVIALTIGGLLGGWLVSRYGLRRMLWWMVAAMHVPNLVFVGLAIYQPTSLSTIGGAIVAEQLGYGFGFTAYMVYMMMVADGPHKTAHYAICTGFMALGVMLPGMGAGWIQEQLGYSHFFMWVVACAVPSIAAAALIKIHSDFGRKAPG